MSRFDECINILFPEEGGDTNDPTDQGGLTHRGVTQATYDDYRKQIGKPAQPVTQAADGECVALYRTMYWTPVHGDTLPPPLDLCVFDCAVNSGTSRAAKILQGCVDAVQDGAIGPTTLAAVSRIPPMTLAAQYCDARVVFLTSIVRNNISQTKYIKGWLNRVNHIRTLSGLPVED
jgi:lysozyme family protein